MIQAIEDKISALREFQRTFVASTFDEMKKYESYLLDLNRDQMMAGQNAEGTDITPSYLDDPYFKTRRQAIGYMNWKQRITADSRRDPQTPNLFIKGDFHNSIRIRYGDNEIEFVSETTLGKDIQSTHPDVLGLNDRNQDMILTDIVYPRLLTEINKI